MVSLDLTGFFQSQDDFMVQSAGPPGEWGGLAQVVCPAVLLTRFFPQGAGVRVTSLELLGGFKLLCLCRVPDPQ